MHLGSGTQARSNAMWSEEIGEGLGCGRRGHRGKGSTHYRTPTDMTGHDRTQPDTKPDIPDMGTRDTVQNTPDTTGHKTGHALPDMLPDMTGHVSGHDRT